MVRDIGRRTRENYANVVALFNQCLSRRRAPNSPFAAVSCLGVKILRKQPPAAGDTQVSDWVWSSAAKKRGVEFGPKPKLAAHQTREGARMIREEGKSLREVAHHYHVGHSTIVRVLGRAEA